MLDLHVGWAWVVILGNALAGIWVTAAHWLPALRARALWWYVVIAELTIFVQVGLGVWLVAGEGIDPPQFHLFYGFVAIIAVGILYSYRSTLAVGARAPVPRVRARQLLPDGPRHPRPARRCT